MVIVDLSESRTLFELGLVVVLAAAAPLIAQVLRLPSILLLLALGFGAGAIGALDPNALLGENLISAAVSVAVGIILFDAGLGLKFRKLTGGGVVRRLLSIGILVTWAVGTIAAYLFFDLSWEVALVLGAVLVVSGPTVVGPLLKFIRPSRDGQLGPDVGGDARRPARGDARRRRVQRRDRWAGGGRQGSASFSSPSRSAPAPVSSGGPPWSGRAGSSPTSRRR